MGLFKVLSDRIKAKSTEGPAPGPTDATSPKWHAHLVLVCEKCGKKIDPAGRLSLDLKDQVKKRVVASGQWGPVRVVTSSCLDLCPEGKIAVGFTGDSGRPSEVIAAGAGDLVTTVLKRLESRLRPPASSR